MTNSVAGHRASPWGGWDWWSHHGTERRLWPSCGPHKFQKHETWKFWKCSQQESGKTWQKDVVLLWLLTAGLDRRLCEEATLRSSASAFLPPWAFLYVTGHNLLVGSCMRGASVALLLSSLSCFCPPGCVGVWVFAGHRGHLRLNASTSVGSFSSVVDCFSPLDFPVSKVAKFLPNEESQFCFFWTLCGGTYPARILDFWSFQWSGFPVSPFLPPIKLLFFAFEQTPLGPKCHKT